MTTQVFEDVWNKLRARIEQDGQLITAHAALREAQSAFHALIDAPPATPEPQELSVGTKEGMFSSYNINPLDRGSWIHRDHSPKRKMPGRRLVIVSHPQQEEIEYHISMDWRYQARRWFDHSEYYIDTPESAKWLDELIAANGQLIAAYNAVDEAALSIFHKGWLQELAGDDVASSEMRALESFIETQLFRFKLDKARTDGKPATRVWPNRWFHESVEWRQSFDSMPGLLSIEELDVLVGSE